MRLPLMFYIVSLNLYFSIDTKNESINELFQNTERTL